jgi:hypothetical protein
MIHQSKSPVPASTGNGAEDRLAHQQDDQTNNAVGAVAQLKVTVAEWQKNKRERLRVSLEEFNGRPVVDIRTYYLDEDDQPKPGRAGLTIAVKHLQQLAPALQAALDEAQRRGLLEGGTT